MKQGQFWDGSTFWGRKRHLLFLIGYRPQACRLLPVSPVRPGGLVDACRLT